MREGLEPRSTRDRAGSGKSFSGLLGPGVLVWLALGWSCAASEDDVPPRLKPKSDAGVSDAFGDVARDGADGGGRGGSGGVGGGGGLDSGRGGKDAGVRDAVSDVSGTCGNFIVEGGEDCDDGNHVGGDGCDANCKAEPAPTYDTCDGALVALTDPGNGTRRGVITGSTVLLTHEYTGLCGGSGKDAVFSFTSDITGRMTARTTSATFNEILYARSLCTNTTSTYSMGCVNDSLVPAGETLGFPVVAGTPYFLFVDALAPASGQFTVELSVTPGLCGNDVVDGFEECDDANTVSGDGCDAACKLEPPGPRDNCPGEVVTLGPPEPRTGRATGSTVNLVNHLTAVTGTPCQLTGATKDAVYQVTANDNGRLTVTLSSTNTNVALFARDNCTSTTPASQIACSNVTNSPGGESISFPARQFTSYWIVVDSTLGDEGSFALDFSLASAVCGNAIVDGGEECDGADVPSGFSCSPTCRIIKPPYDDCPGETITLTGSGSGPYLATISSNNTTLFDDHVSSTCNTTGRDAVYAVTAPITGQLEANVPLAAFNAALYARSTCVSPSSELACVNSTSVLGSERLTIPVLAGSSYYLFVDGSATLTGGSYTLDLSVTAPVCGDGILGGTEQCDDNNQTVGDGCAWNCMLEPPTGNDFCGGQLLPLSPTGNGEVAQITASTLGLASDFQGSCGGDGARDAVYTVQPTITGRLSATLTPNFSAVLYARSACPEGSGQFMCSNLASGTGPETLSVNVVAGTLYYLFVDGVSAGGGSSAGTFTLKIAVTP